MTLGVILYTILLYIILYYTIIHILFILYILYTILYYYIIIIHILYIILFSSSPLLSHSLPLSPLFLPLLFLYNPLLFFPSTLLILQINSPHFILYVSAFGYPYLYYPDSKLTPHKLSEGNVEWCSFNVCGVRVLSWCIGISVRC